MACVVRLFAPFDIARSLVVSAPSALQDICLITVCDLRILLRAVTIRVSGCERTLSPKSFGVRSRRRIRRTSSLNSSVAEATCEYHCCASAVIHSRQRSSYPFR
ncbi:hypothetical protein D3C71_1753940 [compost metagenome]